MSPAMTTLAYWRPVLERLVGKAVKVLDQFCICTRCQDERRFEANRKKARGK